MRGEASSTVPDACHALRHVVLALAVVITGCLAPGTADETAVPPTPTVVVLPFDVAGCTSVSVVRYAPLADVQAMVPAGFEARTAEVLDAEAPAGAGAVAFDATSCPGLSQTVVAVLVHRPPDGLQLERAFDFVELAREADGTAPFAQAGWSAGANATSVVASSGFLGLAKRVEARSALGEVVGTAYGSRDSGTTTRVWRVLPDGLARATTTTSGTYALLAPECEFPASSPMRDPAGCGAGRAVAATDLAWDGEVVVMRDVAVARTR